PSSRYNSTSPRQLAHSRTCRASFAARSAGSSWSSQAISLSENSHMAFLRQLSDGPVHGVGYGGSWNSQHLSNFAIAQSGGAQRQALPFILLERVERLCQPAKLFLFEHQLLRRSEEH